MRRRPGTAMNTTQFHTATRMSKPIIHQLISTWSTRSPEKYISSVEKSSAYHLARLAAGSDPRQDGDEDFSLEAERTAGGWRTDPDLVGQVKHSGAGRAGVAVRLISLF